MEQSGTRRSGSALAWKITALGLSATLGVFALAGCSSGADGSAGSSSSDAASSALDISFSSSVNEDAQQAFRESAEALLARNARLESAISRVQELVDSNPQGADEATLKKARKAIKAAKQAERQVPDVALSTAAVKGQATAMNNITYATPLKRLLACMDALQPGAKDEWAAANSEDGTYAASTTSIQSEQSSSSSSASSTADTDTVLTAKQVAQRIKRVKHVSSVKAVTKKTDPNQLLGTKNGYTAAVFFTSDLVDHDDVYGKGILVEGTDGGGSVEVYATKAKAQKRNKYLAKFDNTKIASGSHKVVGTCVVRTSSKLTTPQQKALTNSLTKALTQTN